jgi:predicted acyl esterase
VDVRGTGSSEGVPEDEYQADEVGDLCQVIAWLAAQDWCDGNVGMYGTSYSGFNALSVAGNGPVQQNQTVHIRAGTRSADGSITNDMEINSRSVFKWFLGTVWVRMAP